jgi:hypothetical protein
MAATEAAMPNNIDPLAYEEHLTQVGVPAEQAHVHAEAIGKVKCELEVLDSKMKSSDDEDKVGRGLAELNTKIDRTKVELEAKIDKTTADLEAKIDKTKAELDAKIDQTKADLEEKIHRAKVETIFWTIGIVISVCSLQGYIIINMLK